MAENAEKEEEPSIEEILDSIRQIIADEDDEEVEVASDSVEPEPEPEELVAPMPEPEPIAEPEPVSEPEEDIVDLTEKVYESPPAIEVDMVDLEEDDIEDDIDDLLNDTDEESLLTAKAENAAVDAIKHLAKKTAIEYNGVTLEDIVRSEIKPMLRTWLDKNLPSLIERLVQEELERVSKRVLDD